MKDRHYTYLWNAGCRANRDGWGCNNSVADALGRRPMQYVAARV